MNHTRIWSKNLSWRDISRRSDQEPRRIISPEDDDRFTCDDDNSSLSENIRTRHQYMTSKNESFRREQYQKIDKDDRENENKSQNDNESMRSMFERKIDSSIVAQVNHKIIRISETYSQRFV